MYSKLTHVSAFLRPYAEVEGLPAPSLERSDWLMKNMVSPIFGNGHYTEATIRAKCLKLGCVGTVQVVWRSKRSYTGSWYTVKKWSFEL